ncbi:hypothetical protein [Rhodoferax sp. OV413]|uniref:hypothetical protein n=1 Tax=Rhodoferax sp. OV413 TaxID=1855285 RepID=UPI0025D25D98|nr:hypothetical protein [Rhodoferax sp. OV413]
MSDPTDSRYAETGFPSLQWEDEELETRPMPMAERPLQAQIDYHMAIIAERHMRIALAIEKFWGHRDCVEYIQTLILNGGYADGSTNRVGFKQEVISSLISLASIHEDEELRRPARLSHFDRRLVLKLAVGIDNDLRSYRKTVLHGNPPDFHRT